MEKQKESILVWLNGLAFTERVKIFFVYTVIDICASKSITIINEKNTNGFKEIPFVFINTNPLLFGSEYNSLEFILQETLGQTNSQHNILITVSHGAVFGINAFYDTFDLECIKSENLNAIMKIESKALEEIKKNLIKIEELYSKIYFETTVSSKTVNLSKYKNLDFKNWNISEILQKKNIPYATVITNHKKIIQILTNKEINNAISQVLKGKKLDVLVLDSCLMQNIFTQFEFRKSTDYLVASLSGISYPGYNYVGVIENLITHINNITPKEVADSFCSTMRSHPDYGLPAIKTEIEGTWSFNSVVLVESQLDKIAEVFGEYLALVNKLNYTLKKYLFAEINSLTSNLFSYDVYSLGGTVGLIDFHLFFKLLNENLLMNEDFKNTEVQKKSAQLSGLLKVYYHNSCSFQSTELYKKNSYSRLKDQFNIDKISCGIPLKKSSTKYELFSLFIKNSNLPHTPSFIKDKNEYSQYLNLLKK